MNDYCPDDNTEVSSEGFNEGDATQSEIESYLKERCLGIKNNPLCFWKVSVMITSNSTKTEILGKREEVSWGAGQFTKRQLTNKLFSDNSQTDISQKDNSQNRNY